MPEYLSPEELEWIRTKDPELFRQMEQSRGRSISPQQYAGMSSPQQGLTPSPQQAPRPTSIAELFSQAQSFGAQVAPAPPPSPFNLFANQGFPARHPTLTRVLEGGLMGAAAAGGKGLIAKGAAGAIAPLQAARQREAQQLAAQQGQTQAGFSALNALLRMQRAQQEAATAGQFTLSPGQVRYGPGGEQIAQGPQESPEPQAGFTLSPGQLRFGPGGEQIAEGGPPTPPAPSTVGVGRTTIIGNRVMQFNPETGRYDIDAGPRPPSQAATGVSAKDRQTAKAKLTILNVAQKQLSNLKEKWNEIRGTLSAGGVQILPTAAGQAFDAAADPLRQTLIGLTRTPGIGAMSDFESRLAMAPVPTRGVLKYESTTEQQIQQVQDLINALGQGYTDMLSESENLSTLPQVDPSTLSDEELDRRIEELQRGR